jgi:uncharacterized RDD family membrane protein YckC
LADAAHQTPSGTDAEAPTQAAVISAESSAVPAMVGGYRLGRRLGEGGMGAVFEAEEVTTGRRVALKLIKPEYAGSPEAVDRFRHEGRVASMVAHPRCVFVLAVDEEAGRPYIVMELMPGATLKDLVSERGALPPDEAVAKILDVIEGLQAAHRLEVIHRDVKPSNCFLEADGRVKVGDFGLAKSLVQDAHLTKTGAFVGTPHFASPEQIRTEPIDARTDVYSVAATLFYLLTGKPPFFGSDTMATLARIVSDPAPLLRSFRPELSPALERVVLRGLERDRDQRWEDLEALRQAIVALVPQPLSLGGLAARTMAYVVDAAMLLLVAFALQAVAAAFLQGVAAAILVGRGVGLLVFFVYFTILEHTSGASLGKLLLGLRVCVRRSIDPPAWGPMALRTVVFLGLLHLGGTVAAIAGTSGLLATHAAWMDPALQAGWLVVGLAVMAAPMRARNGYRGAHDVITGTRVVQPVQPRPRQHVQGSGGWLLSFLYTRRLGAGQGQIGPLPPRIAGFAIRGALKWTPTDKVLLGEDARLGRRVFLWLRPSDAAALDAARRDVGRRTRLRWLGCGKQGDLQWDAILAPLGTPLPDFVHAEGALAWHEARVLLEELASELTAASADGTLPANLTVAQVWVQEDGRPQLADLPLTAATPDEQQPDGTTEERALSLLGRVAVLALEGGLRPAGAPPAALRATLPTEARQACGRLLGIGDRYERVEQFKEALQHCSRA